ncbi:MAG: LysR family transcriptional regulator [Faecalibacterium sp.]
MDISYDYYRAFYYAAKFKNITQAASALLNNQPNVTRTIKNLEAALGCTLFVRTNRGVSLTPEGEKLYSYVSSAFEQLEKAEKELALERTLQKGMVSIGASEVALHSLLLPVLRRFRQIHPGVRLRISNHSTPQAVAALEEGAVELAVITTPADLLPKMEQRELKEIHEVPVCGAAYRELAGRPVSLAELAGYPIICLGSHSKTYELYTQWFWEHGLALTPEIEAATADQILPMVKNDLGIGFVPEDFLVGQPKASGIYRLELREQTPHRCVCIVKKSDRSLSIAAQELERMIVAWH